MEVRSWICLLGLFLLSSSSSFVKASTDEVDEKDENYHEDDTTYDDDEDDEKVVDVEPKIKTEPTVFLKSPGDNVHLKCEGENLNHFATIWQKDTELLVVGENVLTSDKRYKLLEKDSTLIISNLTATDAGKYTCKISSTLLSVSVTHTVHVKAQPRVSLQDPVRVVKSGEPVSLSCNVTGYPEPTVSWERKGKKMPNGQQRVVGSEIMFESVSRHHAGVYECVAVNEYGTATTAMHLQITYMPEIEIERESVNSGKGLEAELVCNVHAEPKAQVIWYKDGRPVDTATNHIIEMSRVYTLHIRGVQESDFGNYTCVANNTHGRANKSILLSGTPSQPVLKNSGLGKDMKSYNLEWSFESTLPVETYTLKYRKEGAPEWTEVAVKGVKTQEHVYSVSHTLEDLSSFADYEVSLSASNKYGESREAQIHKFHINGKEVQSLEAEKEPGAKATSPKGASGASSSSSASSALFLAILLTLLRWQ